MKALILSCLFAMSLGLLVGCSKSSDSGQQAPPQTNTPPASATH